MRPVSSAHFAPLCSITEFTRKNETFCRIKDGTKTAWEWIRQQRHAIVAGTGLTLGLVAFAAGEALTFLPLTIAMIGLGALGMLRQHLAKKALKEGEAQQAKLQKSLTDFKARLPRANRNIQTVEEIETFTNEIIAESNSFQKSLKDNSAGDAKRFQKCLATFVTTHESYKNRLRAPENQARRNELEWTHHAYRNFAQLFLANIQLEAQTSLDREASWVKALRKRAERA